MKSHTRVENLLASLVLTSCVLPEAGGGGVISVDENAGGASSVGGSYVGGNSTMVQAGGTDQFLASGGALNAGGGVGTGGNCDSDSGTGSTGVGGCNCGTGGSGTGGTCPYALPDSADCQTTFCAGECTPGLVGSQYGTVAIVQNSLFGTQLTELRQNDWVVALGAVTLTGSDVGMIPPAASFQLGLYTDNNGQPDSLLGATGSIKAGPESEGLLSEPVFIGDNSYHWILMYDDNTNEVALEKVNTTTPEPPVMFANGVDCLPSPTCPMPKLYDYNSSTYPVSPQFVPFLYARYVHAQ